MNGRKIHFSVSKKICFIFIPSKVEPFFLLLFVLKKQKKKEIKEALVAGIACSTVQQEPFLLSFETVESTYFNSCFHLSSTGLLTSFHFYRSLGLLFTKRYIAASLYVFSHFPDCFPLSGRFKWSLLKCLIFKSPNYRMFSLSNTACFFSA